MVGDRLYYTVWKWYRFYHPRGRISPPDNESTFRTIKNLCDKPDNLEGWEPVPFPSPIHSNLDYVYTVDLGAGTFTISLWSELDGSRSLTPSATRMDLAKVHDASSINHHMVQNPQYMSSEYICGSNNKAQAK
ncbi:hypothetical protein N7530_008003 [Penicillium desertorum]|uniref:Uncharacterized protein n=1 Tax=Penicillium desertorum TaxID=1303715 RepID=A0A9X0BKG7_9EURO|nr:hypothetical protein N7530_008003 [Penicillium desertorum]